MRQMIAGNWKMNGLTHDAEALAGSILEAFERMGAEPEADVLVCPPFIEIATVKRVLAGSRIAIGAQDCHVNGAGAHTGDIAAPMLRDLGVTHVILGHSERRRDHFETDELVREKCVAAARAGLIPIFASARARSSAPTTGRSVVGGQIRGSLPDRFQGIVAYEPVWAIGTGRFATEADVAAMHGYYERLWCASSAKIRARRILVLDGGSVNAANAAGLLGVPEVGALRRRRQPQSSRVSLNHPFGASVLNAADAISVDRSCGPGSSPRRASPCDLGLCPPPSLRAKGEAIQRPPQMWIASSLSPRNDRAGWAHRIGIRPRSRTWNAPGLSSTSAAGRRADRCSSAARRCGRSPSWSGRSRGPSSTRPPGPRGRPPRGAVVSVTFGRTTGTRSRSAWNCSSRLLAAAPPSTRSSLIWTPESFFHDVEDVGHLEGDALQRRAGEVGGGGAAGDAGIVPRAYWSQCGAPSPANAGTM